MTRADFNTNQRMRRDDTVTSQGTLTNVQLPQITKHGLDFPLLISVVLLCAFGIVMLFSASYYYAELTQGDGLHYVKSQSVYLIFGLVMMVIVSHIPYTIFSKKWITVGLYLILIGLLIAVKLFGITLQGAKRWLSLGFITIQPSELSKLILTLCISSYATLHAKQMHRFGKGLFPLLIIVGIPALLIFIQPNLSMLLILLINFFIMAYMSGCDVRWLISIALAGLGLVVAYLLIADNYQSDRFVMVFKSWDELQQMSGNESFQIIQSLYAFANGGLFGQGFDASRQKLLFLPYRESDYILPIISEELGYVAVFLLLATYFFVIWRGLKIAKNCRERFGTLVAIGITSAIGIQVFINAAVVSNMLPATGQTLPFISAGGTSLVSYLISIGILLNISRYTEQNKVKR